MHAPRTVDWADSSEMMRSCHELIGTVHGYTVILCCLQLSHLQLSNCVFVVASKADGPDGHTSSYFHYDMFFSWMFLASKTSTHVPGLPAMTWQKGPTNWRTQRFHCVTRRLQMHLRSSAQVRSVWCADVPGFDGAFQIVNFKVKHRQTTCLYIRRTGWIWMDFSCVFLCNQEQRTLLKDLFQNHRERKTQHKTANRKTSRCAKMMKHVTLKYGSLLHHLRCPWLSGPTALWGRGMDADGHEHRWAIEEAVRHIEEDLLLAIYAAKEYELQEHRWASLHRRFQISDFFHEKSILDWLHEDKYGLQIIEIHPHPASWVEIT